MPTDLDSEDGLSITFTSTANMLKIYRFIHQKLTLFPYILVLTCFSTLVFILAARPIDADNLSSPEVSGAGSSLDILGH